MSRRITYQNEDETDDDQIIDIERQPRMSYERVNYSELYDDYDFINQFRISKSTFNIVLRLIEKEISPPSYISGAILASCKLYMTLRYFATSSFLLTISNFAGTSESSASRYIHQTCRAIEKLRPKFVSFPTNDIDIRKVVTEFYGRSRFPKVIGAIDCTHIKIKSPGGDNAETFRNRKGYFSINVQCICNPWLKITDIVAQWPGSCHNQIIFDNSVIKHKFKTGVIEGYLLGDGAYEVKPYLMTPLLTPTTQSEQLYNESQIRTRNVIERCFEVLKQRFPVLSKGINVNITNTPAIIVACAILHNICIDMHDELPIDLCVDPNDENVRDYIQLQDPSNLTENIRGRQERDRLIRDHFANL